MTRRRLSPGKETGPLLRDIRDPVIKVECKLGDRGGAHDRAALVKMFGASVSFARLRRRAAMGCDRLNGPEGDRCGARFPCLDKLERDGE